MPTIPILDFCTLFQHRLSMETLLESRFDVASPPIGEGKFPMDSAAGLQPPGAFPSFNDAGANLPRLEAYGSKLSERP